MKKDTMSHPPKKPYQLLSRMRNWMHRHPQRTYAIVGLGVIIIALIIVAVIYVANPQKTIDIPPIKITKRPPAPVVHYSPLTGIKVADEAATKQAVTAIMIENSPDARPQSGIKQAGVVYEAIAEGGITRFLALYQEAKPGLIGPVRSVRMYYVDWAAPYNASIAHIGGSAAALAEVRNGNYRDIDQFFNSGSYWRARDRYAPHNVYTNFERLDALNRSKGYVESKFTGFARTDDKPHEAPNATSINMTISGALYNTHYDYDKASNSYLRSIGGAPSDDREEGRITPKVVIAIKVDMTHVMEDGWRESITTSGAGGAVIFQNGIANEVTWRKNSRNDPLQFIDGNGKEVPLNRGQTWITAIPNSHGGVSWQ